MSSNATNRWLDRLAAHDRAKGGTGSDYKLAQVLGVDRQRISRYRRELEQMGNDPALLVAEQLGVHPMIVLADIAAEKSRDVRVQRLWADVAKRYGKKAAFIGAAILTAEIPLALSGSGVLDCILCKVPQRPNPRAPTPAPAPRFAPGRARPLSVLTASQRGAALAA